MFIFYIKYLLNFLLFVYFIYIFIFIIIITSYIIKSSCYYIINIETLKILNIL